MFMTSRDGRDFRIWPESFLRPGPAHDGQLVLWRHVSELGPGRDPIRSGRRPFRELSLYVTESTMQERLASLRRYTLRLDGFVSVAAPLGGGEVVTRPLRFSGRRLLLNASTSAAGSIRVEVQDAEGKPFTDFALADAPEVYGDAIDLPVPWKDGTYSPRSPIREFACDLCFATQTYSRSGSAE